MTITRANAMKAYNKVIKGEVKQMKPDTLEKYKPFYTEEQIQTLTDINKPKPVEDNLINKLRNNPNETITQSTKNKHAFQLSGLLKTFGVKTFEELISTRSKEEIVQTIRDVYTAPTTYINLFLIIFKHIAPELGNEEDIKFYESQKSVSNNEAIVNSFEARSNDLTDYEKLYLDLMEKKPNSLLSELILMLYRDATHDDKGDLKMVPRNYFHSVVIGDDLTVNSYNPETGVINIVDFKTSKNFKYNYVLPKKVQEFIKQTLINSPRIYLVSKGGKHHYSEQTLSTFVRDTLGMNIITYRKVMENILGRTQDRLTVANSMGHNVATAFREYLINE